ncbi:Uncharacterised protein [Vibrio cholerae]|nr:Uncharacterised protein [Vibrio cholerae]
MITTSACFAACSSTCIIFASSSSMIPRSITWQPSCLSNPVRVKRLESKIEFGSMSPPGACTSSPVEKIATLSERNASACAKPSDANMPISGESTR